MQSIETLLKDLQALIDENKRLKSLTMQYETQLMIIGVNKPDEYYDYDDINKIDLDKVRIGTSFNRVSVYNADTNKKITSYKDLPVK